MFLRNILNRRAARFALAIPASLVLVVGVAACGGDDDDDDEGTSTPSSSASPTTGGGGGATAEPITITMTDNVFNPKEIEVPVNTEVEITVENKGAAVHNMHVLSAAEEGKDFSSDALVQPGKTSTFTVKFTKTGEYKFQCDYHLPDMSGTIEVE